MQPGSIVQDVSCALSLASLRCQVRLGCGADERAKPQDVSFDLSIKLDRLPEGSKTDRLEGTFCYAEISDAIRAVCAEREFHLIESLGYEAYRRVEPLLVRAGGRIPPKLWLKVTKLRPPVSGLEGGASFELGSR
jgi:dihydroneopterin aldolase